MNSTHQPPDSKPSETPESTPPANAPPHTSARWWHPDSGEPFQRFSLLSLLVLVCYAFRSTLEGGFIWDDEASVVGNPSLTSFWGLVAMWVTPSAIPSESHYWPITYTTLWIEYQLFGLDPLYYRLTNLLLHLANTALAWRLLRRLGIPAPVLGAALFALHPLRSESVAWIIERKDVLSGLFYLLALDCWWRARTSHLAGELRRARFADAAVFVFFTLGMWSKTVVFSLPLTAALLVWWKDGRITRRDGLRIGLLAAWSAVLTVYDVSFTQKLSDYVSGLTFLERVQVIGFSITHYVRTHLWPVGLHIAYPKPPIGLTVWTTWLYPVGVLAALALAWHRRNQWGRGPLVAALAFCVTLGPTLGLIDHGFMSHSYVADRFTYLASLAFAALLAAGWPMLARRVPTPAVRLALPVVLSLTLAALTASHTRVFRSNPELYENSIRRNPHSWMPLNNLAFIYMQRGEFQRAEAMFRVASRNDPTRWESEVNIAICLMGMGKFEQALEQNRKTEERWPERFEPWLNDAILRGRLKDYPGAMNAFAEAMKRTHDFPLVYRYLSSLQLDMQQYPAARDTLRKLHSMKPHYDWVLHNLGGVYLMLGEAANAQKSYTLLASRNPRDAEAWFMLGAAASMNADRPTAVRAYASTLAVSPRRHEAMNNLAWILATAPEPAVRNPQEALRLAQAAVSALTPEDIQASPSSQWNYGGTYAAALAANGNFDQAAATLRQAMNLAARAGDTAFIESSKTRLMLFVANQPYVDSSGGTASGKN